MSVARRLMPSIGIRPEPKVLVPILKLAFEQSDMDPSLTVPALNALAEAGDRACKR